jgi:hypothetical protein
LVTTKGITIGNEKNEEEKKKKDVSLSQTKLPMKYVRR